MAQQWYLAIGGQKVGPLSEDDTVRRIRGGEIDAGTLVFTAGMTNWTPLGAVPGLATYLPGASVPAAGGPPPLPGRRAPGRHLPAVLADVVPPARHGHRLRVPARQPRPRAHPTTKRTKTRRTSPHTRPETSRFQERRGTSGRTA